MSDPIFKICTLGCKVNQYDSQEIRERFLECGVREASQSQKADIYIVNTCTVTRKADKESLYAIRRSFRENPRASIVVTGCMAEFNSGQLKKEPGVSRVIKNRDKERIVFRIIKEYAPPRKGVSFFEGRTRAFLKIQDGCDNFCSYCIVPHVRGKPRSKPLADVLREARQLVDNGYREIVLTGICLGFYGRDLKPSPSIASVIDGLEAMPGLRRIRLSSVEAKDIGEQLIRCFGRSKKLCRHMHIPIQSGDNTILRAMHRRYTRRDYLDLVTRLRRVCPAIAITTDVLIGFPGEQERHFLNTLDLVRRIMPLKTHIFPYSPRPGTRAYQLHNSLSHDSMKSRLERMSSLAAECAVRYQKGFLSSVMAVLVETRSQEQTGAWEGYTDNYLKVMFRTRKDVKNRLIRLRLKKVTGDKILGILP